jgi:hypothetical protein
VPASRGGLRVALNAAHTAEQVDALFASIALHLPAVLASAGVTRAELDAQFEAALPRFLRAAPPVRSIVPIVAPRNVEYRVQSARSIHELRADEWDDLLGAGAFVDASSMASAESVFHQGRDLPEQRWKYRYVLVRDDRGVAAATVFTSCLVKDDAFMSGEVSEALEIARRDDPYLFTSQIVGTGTMASEGMHIHLRDDVDKNGALLRLIEEGVQVMESEGCRSLVFGDFPGPCELAPLFTANGFVPLRVLDNYVLHLDWRGTDVFIQRLQSRTRRRHVRQVADQEALFRCEYWSGRDASDETVEQLHALYMNLARKNLRINIFPMPPELVRAHLRSGSWDFVVLWSSDPGRTAPVAFGASRQVGAHYRALYCGVDYEGFSREVSPYRQLLWQVLKRAGALGCKQLHLGMGAEREKQKFGAVPVPTYAFVRTQDDYAGAQLQAFVERIEHVPRAVGAR